MATENKCKNVLIAEDDEVCAQSMAQLLALYGHTVRTASDGLRAIELAEEECPDVAIVDITLPKLNGFSVARRLRAQDLGRRTTLIAVTGWSQEETRQSAEGAGFEFFLTKPVDPEYLLRLVAAN